MSRPPRLEFSVALYYVTSQGDRRSLTYRDDIDRPPSFDRLALMCERHHRLVHSFFLIFNYFYLMLEKVEPNLGLAMRNLNRMHTQRFNRRHNTIGHLFQGGYKAILVQKESYLLELTRYLALYPVSLEDGRFARRIAMEQSLAFMGARHS